jgi:hypothetical protein
MTPIMPLASLLISLQLFLGGLARGVGPGSGPTCPVDSAGSAVWAKKFDLGYNPWPDLNYGIPLAGGGCLAVGDVGPLSGPDGWIVQFSAAGTIEKQGSYALQKNGRLQAIAPTADGGYIAAGRMNFNEYGDDGDGWLMKLDKDLIPKWNKTYALGERHINFEQVACLPDGGFLLAGLYSGAYDSLIVKANSTGGIVWAHEFPGTIFYAMIPTPDKGLLALVTVYGEVDWLPTLIKLDSTGKVKWAKQSDNFDAFVSGFVTKSGDFIIGGHSGSQNLVMKVSGGGAIKWQSAFGSTFSYMSKVFPAPGGGAYFVTPNSINPTTQVVIAKVTGTGGLSFARGFAPFTQGFQESADHAFSATDGSIIMLCNYVASTAIVRFDANGRTDPKCTPFPIKYKRTNPKLALEDISITPKNVKLTVKTAKVTRKATTARLEDACK